MEQKIPKIIHYCWFGGNPLPEMAQKCLESWKKFCPDYEIMEWNEQSFPVDYNDYVKEAYEAKKWAFVSDVSRLYALVNYGGVYMDTDVELLKPIDEILTYDAISGFESSGNVPTGLMACSKGHEFFKRLLADYDGEHFIMKDGSYNLTTNVVRITRPCVENGLVLNDTEQTVCGFTFKPHDVFCPKDHITKELNITENTIAIHHFDGSWLTPEAKYTNSLLKKYKNRRPKGLWTRIAYYKGASKYRGFFRGACADLFKNIKLAFKKGK